MNALLLMTSTFVAGADVPVAAHDHAPAAVAGCGTGCNRCDPCPRKPSILDKFKSRLGSRNNNDCCAPAPTCCAKPAPAPKCCTPAPAACDPCASARPNLLDKIKSKLHGRKNKSDCCAPACDGCGAAPAHPVHPPKPMDPKKVGSEGAAPIAIPTPGAIKVPSLPATPVTPVSGPKLTGATSPY